MTRLLSSPIFWSIVIIAVIVATVLAMNRVRENALREFAQPNQAQAWDEWRTAASKSDGPVARRKPKSKEPPTLVLLRDYYGICLGGMLAFETAILAFFGATVRGTIRSGRNSNR